MKISEQVVDLTISIIDYLRIGLIHKWKLRLQWNGGLWIINGDKSKIEENLSNF